MIAAIGLLALAAGLVVGPTFDDPLKALLIAVPGTGLALAGLATSLGVRGRLANHPPVAILLTALTLASPRFGIDGIEVLLTSAWLLLLGHAVVTLLGPLDRRLARDRAASSRGALTRGARTRGSLSWHFWVLPFTVHLAIASWALEVRPPDGDEPYNLLLAHSLITDADVDLTDEYADGSWRRFIDRPLEPQRGDPRGEDGEIYSRHNFFLPLLIAPAYALGGRAGAAIVIAFLAAMTALVVGNTATRLESDSDVDPRSRRSAPFLAWLLLALTPPMLIYSHQIWVEVPAALALAIAIDRLWRLRAGWRASDLAVLAVAMVALVALKIRFALLAISVFTLVAWTLRRYLTLRTPDTRTRGLIIGGVGMLSILAVGSLLWRNHALLGNPLRMHELGEIAIFDRPLVAFFLGAGGLFFDSAFGLFASAPVWMLLVPALFVALVDSSGRGRTLAADAVIIGLPYLLVLAPRLEWYGGWSPPFRYAVVLLPPLTLFLLPLLARRHGGLRMIGGALVLVSLLLGILWLSVPGWTYNLADGGSHLLDGAGTRLGADLGRFFPSMVRPRLASWLWPMVTVLLAPLVFLRWPRHHAATWGATLALVAIAALPLIAKSVPTRTIELEDGYVRTRGGHLSPRPWTIERPRFRGGWTLRAGNSAVAPVNGEGTVRLRVAARFVIKGPHLPFHLDILAGDRRLMRVPATTHQVWQVFDIEDVEWSAGTDLVVRAEGERQPGDPTNGVVVDYVDFHWQ